MLNSVFDGSTMDYGDFLRLVLPNDSALRGLATQRPNYDVKRGQSLSPAIEKALCRVLEAEIVGAHKIDSFRSLATACKDFTAFDAFRDLDRGHTGCIGVEELADFLKRTGCITRMHDPELFLRRFDTDMDGLLSRAEFFQGIAKVIASSPAKGIITTERKHLKPFVADMDSSSFDARALTPEKSSAAKTAASTSAGKRVSKKLDYAATMDAKGFEPEEPLMRVLGDRIMALRRLERAKADLAGDPNFNFIDAFKLFDPAGKAYITLAGFREALKGLNLAPSCAETSLLFSRCGGAAGTKSGKLRYSMFCDFVAPRSPSLAGELYSRPARDADLSKRLKSMLKSLFEAALQVERQRGRSEMPINTQEAFRDLAGHYGKGSVAMKDLKKRAEKGNLGAKDTELALLFAQFDHNADGMIGFDEFAKELGCQGISK